MTLITKQKVQQLIYILKQENSRSLFLSCLPGDFRRTRTKLDLARLDDFQPGFSERLLAAFKSGGSVNYSPTEIDLDSALDQAVVTKKLSALFDQGRVQEKEKGSNPLKIGFPILVQENRSASFRIALAGAAYFGKGYGSEATQLIVDFGFRELKLHRIELEVYDFNPRAQHVYEKAGFVKEGVRRDVLLWDGVYQSAIVMSILEDEWREARVRSQS